MNKFLTAFLFALSFGTFVYGSAIYATQNRVHLFCAECGGFIGLNDNYCKECGKAVDGETLVGAKRICPTCGKDYSVLEDYCPKDGSHLFQDEDLPLKYFNPYGQWLLRHVVC